MLRKLANSLHKLTKDQRGNNLIAYALVLGAIGVAGAGYLAQVSDSLKTGLNNQASKIALTAGTTWQIPGSSPSATPGSPTSGTPTAGSPTSGSGNGNGGAGKGKGKGKGNK